MKQLFTFLAAVLVTVATYGQVGIGTTTVHASTILELKATDKALLLPRVATNASVTTPVNGMMIYDIANNCVRVYEDNNWSDCLSGKTAITAVVSPTGLIWMDRNLGATQVATSSTDIASYGDLYQWGRGTDGHQIRTSGTTSILSSLDNPGNANFIITNSGNYDWRSPQNNNLWQGVNGINNPCPAGYRLPLASELSLELGYFSTNDAAGAFASVLKLPVAGYRNMFTTGSLYDVGSLGYYWSSTVSGTDASYLVITNMDVYTDSYHRGFGFSVRCLKD